MSAKLSDYKNEWDELPEKNNLSCDDVLYHFGCDGLNLQYINNQTEEICLAAVKQNGYALEFIKNQTEEICLAAIKRDADALKFVSSEMFKNKSKKKRIKDLEQRVSKLETEC